MLIKKLIILFLLFVINLNAQTNNKVTLYLDWIHQFQFAGYYVAKEKGYYADVALNIDIKEINDNSDNLKDIMTKDAAYGVENSSLIIDKFNGNDLVLLSSIYQSSPLVLISLKESNIKHTTDLKNKRLKITNDAVTSASINSIIISQGIKLDELIIQKHLFNINDLINKKPDAMAYFLSNEAYFLDKKNIEYNVLNPDEYSFDFYKGILYTSQKELLNNPSRVQNFTKASLKGWEYAFNNIEETAKIIHEKYNTQNKSLDSLIYEGNILKKLSKMVIEKIGDINTKTIDEIKYLENNNFTLLVEDNNIPFVFKLTNKLTGMEIDFWNLISKKLSKPLNIEETINDTMFNIFSDSIKTKFVYGFEKKNKPDYLLSEPIAQIPIVLATKNDKNFIQDLSTLEKIKIGVLKNLEIISTLQKEYPNINFVEIENINDAILQLEKNNIFALIDNLYTISHKIDKNNLNNIKINTLLTHKLNIYLEVVQKDSLFLNILNSAINRFSQEEKNTILNNYQFIFYPKNIDFFFIGKIVIPFILLLAIFIYFNFKLKKEIIKRKEIEQQLSELANKDSLTNIFNRRKIEEICETELIRKKRYKENLSIIFFDINSFKIINDSLGHHLGDEVLVRISDIIGKSIRSTDSLGRWGGDEFLIVLPQTNLSQGKNIITHLEKRLSQIQFSKSIIVTCSFGITTCEEDDTLDSLLKKADESMYLEKTKIKERTKD